MIDKTAQMPDTSYGNDVDEWAAAIVVPILLFKI